MLSVTLCFSKLYFIYLTLTLGKNLFGGFDIQIQVVWDFPLTLALFIGGTLYTWKGRFKNVGIAVILIPVCKNKKNTYLNVTLKLLSTP